jgi:hypothetical protein
LKRSIPLHIQKSPTPFTKGAIQDAGDFLPHSDYIRQSYGLAGSYFPSSTTLWCLAYHGAEARRRICASQGQG